MSVKYSVEKTKPDNDFESIVSLNEDELEIGNLLKTTPELEKKALDNQDFGVVLSNALQNSIHEIVVKTMAGLGISKENRYPIEDLANRIQNFVELKKAGSFEFYSRAGKNVFKCKHNLGTMGSQFFKDLITSSLKVNFADVTYHTSESDESVSIVFRQI